MFLLWDRWSPEDADALNFQNGKKKDIKLEFITIIKMRKKDGLNYMVNFQELKNQLGKQNIAQKNFQVKYTLKTLNSIVSLWLMLMDGLSQMFVFILWMA